MSFFDDSSLAFLPSGAAGKDGKAYSIKPTDGTGDFTFSRGSNLAATRVGPTGLIEKGRENLLLQSNQFDTTWTNASTTEASGFEGYDGTNDAWKLTKSAASGRIQQSTFSAGVYSFSVYVKANTNNWVQLYLDTTTPNDPNAFFDLQNGLVGTTSDNIDASIQSIGNGWYRCSVVGSVTTTFVAMIFPAEADNDKSATSGSIYIQDAQLEIGLAATDYIESGATKGKAGLLENEPRFDYSGGATCPSLLLEPSRTNVITYSEQIDNAAWTKTNTTITANALTSPDGYQNAAVLVENSTSNAVYAVHRASRPSGLTINTTYSISFFAKKVTRDFCYYQDFNGFQNPQIKVFFNLASGIVGTATTGVLNPKMENYGNGWYRCSFQFLSNSTTLDYRIGSATSDNILTYTGVIGQQAISLTNCQFETGSYPTSYIPNHSGGSVTRGADDAVATGLSSVIGQTEGTFYVDFEYLDGQSAANENWFALESDDGNQRILWYKGSTPRQRFLLQANGTSVFSNSSLIDPLVAGTRYKMAVRYNSGDIAIYINGSQIATDTSTYTMSTNLNEVTFNESLQSLSSRFNQMLVFPEGLSNADLTTLTTL